MIGSLQREPASYPQYPIDPNTDFLTTSALYGRMCHILHTCALNSVSLSARRYACWPCSSMQLRDWIREPLICPLLIRGSPPPLIFIPQSELKSLAAAIAAAAMMTSFINARRRVRAKELVAAKLNVAIQASCLRAREGETWGGICCSNNKT